MRNDQVLLAYEMLNEQRDIDLETIADIIQEDFPEYVLSNAMLVPALEEGALHFDVKAKALVIDGIYYRRQKK